MPTPDEIARAVAPAVVEAMKYQVLTNSHGPQDFTFDGGRNIVDILVQTRMDVTGANTALGQVLQLLGQQHGVSAQDIAAALAPLVIAALPAHLTKLGADDLKAIAAAVVAEEGRRLAAPSTPIP